MIKSLASRFGGIVTGSLSPSQDDALYAEDPAAESSPDLNLTTLQPWERLDKLPTTYIIANAVTDGDDEGNLWAAEEEQVKLKPSPQEMPECRVHGLICKKGICKERSKIVREQERAKKEQEKKTSGNAKGRGRKGDALFIFTRRLHFCTDTFIAR